MKFSSKACLLLAFVFLLHKSKSQAIEVVAELHWRYSSPSGACEIAAYSAETERLFLTTGGGVDVVDLVSGQQIENVEQPMGYHATSVACSKEIVAVAWAADDKRKRGIISFYDALQLVESASHPVGYLPDMIAFTSEGSRLLVANEGEPNDDYSFDPEGTISIITVGETWVDATVQETQFTKFNDLKKQMIDDGVRIFGPNQESPDGLASVAQDLEPEYIAIDADAKFAWITLQENNAIAELDIERAEIVRVYPLGLKDFRARGNSRPGRLISATTGTGLDVSDQDGGIRIRHWPIVGMFQPDGIATFQQGGEDFLVTANEGDPRDYATYTEAVQIGALAEQGIPLDHHNPARSLVNNPDLSQLEVSRAAGDRDGDGDLDQLACFGTRSFSIWKRHAGELIQAFDSGNEFEQIIAREAPHLFNVDSKPSSKTDDRSTTRGPEPENVVLFTLDRRRIAAIGLERTGGVMFYDISNPMEAKFLSLLRPDADQELRDRAPEGLLFIASDQNPHRKPLLVVCNEASGTMTAHVLSLNQTD
ncbi:choice-of-anchor I family protein [Bythopirellula polymerisocia]|uniref:Choice-of-anchor I domain-containing protein n=1 Tax=Bythopirellula polymerisocia TaxID=2528003 RepID=A0A5C6CJS1_9BACT|nr:choice-of-anchor I family protein [Bythopirellula polymerisocia]TWU23837.1 hypothetical protein Pla144_40130 [Bythopirellula polymerisocia]